MFGLIEAFPIYPPLKSGEGMSLSFHPSEPPCISASIVPDTRLRPRYFSQCHRSAGSSSIVIFHQPGARVHAYTPPPFPLLYY